MILKLSNINRLYFARSRIRQQIKFEPRLKDFTTHHDIAIQQSYLRQKYQQIPSSTFTSVLQNRKPKLSKRFYIQKNKLNKNIKIKYKQNIRFDNLQLADQKQFDYLTQSKSYLFNNNQQIQFQFKFQQHLFRQKQTQRLLKIKSLNIFNYIPSSNQDNKYLSYIEKKNILKNQKISNMMKFSKNNQLLQLLIESGLTHNPENLQIIINELNSNNKQEKPQLLSHHSNQNYSTNKQLAIRQQTQQQLPQNITQKLDDIGPDQLKDREKILQFIQNYRQQHKNDQKQCLADLNLLKDIRQYQQQLFLSRYQSINFRFKGRVTFQFFKQHQLISYIKNEKIQPKDLLLIFKQNRNKLNKLNTPIITPPVMGALYAKTSLYQYPQTDQNSQIYMLNDHNFQNLQRQIFRQITKLSNQDFCSVVFAFAHNHQIQQGILNKKLNNKINQVIYNQVHFRIYTLNEQDLGLLLRGLVKIPITTSPLHLFQLSKFLQNKLPLVNNLYTIQSIFQFILCLPLSYNIQQIILTNIHLYSSYQWQQINTLLSFCHGAGLLLNQYKNLANYKQIKNLIQSIIVKANDNLPPILQKISINMLPHFLIVFIQSQAAQKLPKTANLCKKLVIDNIRTQKQLIKQQTLINLLNSFVLMDTQKYFLTKKLKYIPTNEDQSASTIMRKLCIKYLTVFQPIPYNSSLYLIYHQLARFIHTQMPNLKDSTLSKLLQQLSVARYKNQKLLDDIAIKIFSNIQGLERSSLDITLLKQSDWHITKQLIAIANSYILQRRNTNIFRDVIKQLMTAKYFYYITKQPINLLIRLVAGIVGLKTKQIEYQKKLQWIINTSLLSSVAFDLLTQQQIAAVAYSCAMLNMFQQINRVFGGFDLKMLSSPTCKFVIAFCKMLAKMALENDKQSVDRSQFDKYQQQFYKQTHKQIQFNSMCIGNPISYSQVYKKIFEINRNKHPDSKMQLKKWRIQIPSINEVYFIASYDHLQINQYQEGQKIVQISGIWKLYQKYYSIYQWKINLVISFLQGK